MREGTAAMCGSELSPGPAVRCAAGSGGGAVGGCGGVDGMGGDGMELGWELGMGGKLSVVTGMKSWGR